MRIIFLLSIILNSVFFEELNAQMIQLESRKDDSIILKSSPHKIDVLLIIQLNSNKSKQSNNLDAQLAYYDLDWDNITLHVVKFADGQCRITDPEIDFGDFKISRKNITGFYPFKLYIPVPKNKSKKIYSYFQSKLDESFYRWFQTKDTIIRRLSKRNNSSGDYALEISADRNYKNLTAQEFVVKLLSKKNLNEDFKYQLDSLSNCILNAELKIDSISNIKKNSMSLNIGSANILDNLSISLKNLMDFKINFATVYKEHFQHTLGLNIGYINANNSIQLDQLFVNSNQKDNNGDIFNGNYHLTNYIENTQFNILKLGISNTFSFKLSNSIDLSFILNTGALNLLSMNTHVVSGIVSYTGDYPQYQLSNFNEPTLGFGNFELTGSRNNYLNTKSSILFFEPGLQMNFKLSEIFNAEALSSFGLISNFSWLITEDFISNKKSMFSNSPATSFNSANNTLKKLYITNLTYSIGLSWKF